MILILCGSYEALSGIKSVKELGYKVIVADGNFNCPGKKYSDHFIHADIYNPELFIKKLSISKIKDKITGVITVAADNVQTWAYVAEYLNLIGPSKIQAEISVNKLKQKKY